MGLPHAKWQDKLKKVNASPVCEDCGTIMFQRGIDLDFGKKMIGWACPKCHTTKWDEINETK
jgi:tRNA(Ile2) C34 agmatinyltransferase TiaS